MNNPDPATVSPASVLAKALEWKAAGAGVVLATVVKAWFTAPRRAGTQMAVHSDGTRVGSLFGPAIDPQVATAALNALAKGEDRMVDLAVDDAVAPTAGMACGGGMKIRLERVAGEQLEVLKQAVNALDRRESVVLCTGLSDRRRELVFTDEPGMGAWATEAARRARNG